MKRTILSFLAAFLCASTLHAQENTDSVKSPTMGWSSWNTYGANISESIIKRQADAMIRYKLKDVGYQYINIDDGFFNGRDADGHLVIHPTRFPNGLKPVVDYIHSKGLKAGIYSDAGHNTCASYHGGEKGGIGAGLLDHDQEDCDLYFKELEFDFFKVDFCGGVDYHNSEKLNLNERERYEAIAKAIKNTGREVVFNACRWDYPGTWILDVADSWRTTGDINASWGSVKDIIAQNLYLSAYARNGHYNDMDMLEVGRGMTTTEDRTHFSIWCIMASPLLIGCDMSNMTATTRNLLTNTELIALNQDRLGLQAYVAKASGGTYILVKDLEEHNGLTRAVALYNPTDNIQTMTLSFADVDLAGKVLMRDLINKRDEGEYEDSYTVNVPAHGTRVFRLTAEHRLMRSLYEAETAWLTAYQELSNNQWAETAIYSADSNCSGGEKVGWLGKKADNDLQWRNVYVDEEGEYEMELFYMSGENRNVSISVNGGSATRISCNSGGWGTVGSKKIRIHLQQGNNVIRLFNPSAWMPDIDCMKLTLIEPSNDIHKPRVVKERDQRIYTTTGIQISNTSSLVSPLTGELEGSRTGKGLSTLTNGIYIANGRKILKR